MSLSKRKCVIDWNGYCSIFG